MISPSPTSAKMRSSPRSDVTVDFDQALLDAIAAIATVAGHKERFPSLGGALEGASKQLRPHLRRQAAKYHARSL